MIKELSSADELYNGAYSKFMVNYVKMVITHHIS